jgi:deaminated glutathione amidase
LPGEGQAPDWDVRLGVSLSLALTRAYSLALIRRGDLMTPFAIGGIQMPLSATADNLTAMGRRLDLLMARYPWVQMVVFSELAAFGPLPQYAQALPGPAEATFQAMAARHGVWLLPGSLYEKSGGKIYNTAPVIDPSGAVVARYRKMFPFRPYEQATTPGQDFVVFDVPAVGRFGVSICYDMWFPETTRTLAAMGAEVILHPTLTDTIDRDIELAISRASAAQNQCFWFDINGLAAGGVGRSLVVGPSGDVLHQAGGEEEVIPLEIDLDRVRRERDVGLRGLGQPLKSFRDRSVDFAVYRREGFDNSFLDGLGPLALPRRAPMARPKRRPAL